ncbi:DUF2795 domain-containing protein [Rickettsiales endosymbiont of Stachyamoeba lipophora]|uniref:DUF2795 domain-containing protein n=1 Tax=Rickettsiales endosymbiont of Stachyamoeba lipophora TaxID=2486578 RepID=UPI000F650141|nr:DUF2795 domain-containing protein [Rickettsiales endosymbiont of Stachyamoeba lipophora]AZL16299.1 DUF2795 domain-containing protein [Rickettsiales endosymbiont of Stachyamoeba lipophora]
MESTFKNIKEFTPNNDNSLKQQVLDCLNGLEFPVDKDDIIDHAEQSENAWEVMRLIYKMGDKEYSNNQDISLEIQEIMNNS